MYSRGCRFVHAATVHVTADQCTSRVVFRHLVVALAEKAAVTLWLAPSLSRRQLSGERQSMPGDQKWRIAAFQLRGQTEGCVHPRSPPQVHGWPVTAAAEVIATPEPHPTSLSYAADGAQRFASALSAADLLAIEATFEHLPQDRAGVRLTRIAGLAPLLAADGCVGSVASALIGSCKPVRAGLFNKSPAANWALGWHQDRTIAVDRRIEVPGFRAWNRKSGVLHVEPPFALLERMVTLRVHLDATDADNAPLLIAPGSHRLGRLTEAQVPAVVKAYGVHACLAERGDIWAYATPILHASEAARRPARRRVLQVDYSGNDLPGGLAWAGV